MGIQFKQNNDASMGLQGTDGDEGGFVVLSMQWSAIMNTSGAFLTCSPHILNRRMVVKAITHHNDTAASNAVTATVKSAPAGTALGSGTTLHTGTASLQAAASTPVSLTLSSTAGVLDLAAGTRIGFVISGTPGAAGVGTFTVTLAPA